MWLETLYCSSRTRSHKNGKEFQEVEWAPCVIDRAWKKTKLQCWRIYGVGDTSGLKVIIKSPPWQLINTSHLSCWRVWTFCGVNSNTLSFQLNLQLKILLDLFVFFFSTVFTFLSLPKASRCSPSPSRYSQELSPPTFSPVFYFPSSDSGFTQQLLPTLQSPLKADFTFSSGACFCLKLYLHFSFHEEELQTAVSDYLHWLKVNNMIWHHGPNFWGTLKSFSCFSAINGGGGGGFHKIITII